MGKKFILSPEKCDEILSYKESGLTLKAIAQKCSVTVFKARIILHPEKYIINPTPKSIFLTPIEDLDFEKDGFFDVDKWSKITY